VTTRPQSARSKTIGRLLGLALEIPPAAYIAITGHTPTWARVWLAVWLSFWLLVTVVTSTKHTT
jgi:hypothetical protein